MANAAGYVTQVDAAGNPFATLPTPLPGVEVFAFTFGWKRAQSTAAQQ